MQCKHTKENGEQCNANAMTESDYCYTHNPAISEEERREAKARGGSNRALIISQPLPIMPINEPQDAIMLIADTISRVRAGELDIRTANCLGFLTDKLLKAFEVAKLNDKVELVSQLMEKSRK